MSQGVSFEHIDDQAESLREGRNILSTLQEKLCAYRLIGKIIELSVNLSECISMQGFTKGSV